MSNRQAKIIKSLKESFQDNPYPKAHKERMKEGDIDKTIPNKHHPLITIPRLIIQNTESNRSDILTQINLKLPIP
jgi:hypothetical protein